MVASRLLLPRQFDSPAEQDPQVVGWLPFAKQLVAFGDRHLFAGRGQFGQLLLVECAGEETRPEVFE